MKAPGDRKKQSAQLHPDKYVDKYSSSSKSKHGMYQDRRQPATEKASTQNKNEETPPSQHLWVGNVSASVTKTMLAEQFSRFGDIESIKLFSQKNYAFVTLKTVEDAIYAKKGLHGTVIGGLAVRIEFARGAQDSRLNIHAEGDEKILKEKEKQIEEKIIYQDKVHKDSTQENNAVLLKVATLDDSSRQFSDVSKGNKNGDPSEVLWIGFPLHLKIDENKLRKLFAPFGGVEKITTFPGRTYAFVRFQNVKAASRAKDALQGKLFDDPRVSISFAKSEVGPVDHFHASSDLRLSTPLKPPPRTISSSSMKGEEGISNSSAKLEMEPNKYRIASPKKNLFLSSTPIPSFGHSTSYSELAHVSKDSVRSANHIFPSRPGTSMSENFFAMVDQSTQAKIRNTNRKDEFSGIFTSKHLPKPDLDKGMVVRNDESVELKVSKSDDNWPLRDYSNNVDNKRVRSEMENMPMGGLFSLVSPPKILENLTKQVDDGGTKRQRLGNDLPVAETKSTSLPDYVNQRGGQLSHEAQDDQLVGNVGLLGRAPLGNSKKDVMNTSLRSEQVYETKDGSHKSLISRLHSADLSKEQPSGSQSEMGLVESPISPTHTDGGSPICLPSKDVFRWEGTIAKGGTEVCHCRCFPATKEINVIFPDTLNCTARTSLDMLAQYISQVKEFAVVLFRPQGVLDVAPYQELMAFLADKKRAAVCKLSEENTLFLVPPSDFVEQFLNVPKSNNILGVVLGQQQQRSQSSQMLVDHNLLHRSNDSKIAATSFENHSEFYTCPSADVRLANSLASQQIIYPPETSKGDPGVPASFQDMSGKNRFGSELLQEHDMAMDKSRILFGTHGGKTLTHDNNLLPDIRNAPFQIPGSLPMPMPVAHNLQVFGSASLPPRNPMPARQDSVLLSRPPYFSSPQTPEQLSASASNQMMNDSQKPSGSVAFPERPWAIPGTPPSVLMTQVNPPAPHLQQALSYGTTSQQKFSSFDGRQQDGQTQPPNFAFRLSGTSSRDLYASNPLVPDSVSRPSGLPSSLPALESSVRPPAPPIVPIPSSNPQDQEKQGPETEQQRAIHAALARMQNPDSSEEEQKKFRATVELAAALLLQLQQQTKL